MGLREVAVPCVFLMLEFTGEGRLVPRPRFLLLWRTNIIYAENEIVQVKWMFFFLLQNIVLICTIVTISSSPIFGVHSVRLFLHAYTCIKIENNNVVIFLFLLLSLAPIQNLCESSPYITVGKKQYIY